MRTAILEKGVAPALFVSCITQLTKDPVPNGDEVAPLSSRTKMPEMGNNKIVVQGCEIQEPRTFLASI